MESLNNETLNALKHLVTKVPISKMFKYHSECEWRHIERKINLSILVERTQISLTRVREYFNYSIVRISEYDNLCIY
jgi:hypothetical protein